MPTTSPTGSPPSTTTRSHGHEFLFFGADRTAVNGAKDLGFWFFKSPVSLNDDGTFNGVHTRR